MQGWILHNPGCAAPSPKLEKQLSKAQYTACHLSPSVAGYPTQPFTSVHYLSKPLTSPIFPTIHLTRMKWRVIQSYFLSQVPKSLTQSTETKKSYHSHRFMDQSSIYPWPLSFMVLVVHPLMDPKQPHSKAPWLSIWTRAKCKPSICINPRCCGTLSKKFQDIHILFLAGDKTNVLNINSCVAIYSSSAL